MSERTGRAIRELVKVCSVDNTILWQMSDADFSNLLCRQVNPEQLAVVKKLDDEGIPHDDKRPLPLLKGAKVRTIDPYVWQPDEKKPAPLSSALPI
jgi:hypothetical protein